MLLRQLFDGWLDSREWWKRPPVESVRHDMQRQRSRILRRTESIEHIHVQLFAHFCFLCCSNRHRLGNTFNFRHYVERFYSSTNTDWTDHSTTRSRLFIPGLLQRQRRLQSLDWSRQPRGCKPECCRKVCFRLHWLYVLWCRIFK